MTTDKFSNSYGILFIYFLFSNYQHTQYVGNGMSKNADIFTDKFELAMQDFPTTLKTLVSLSVMLLQTKKSRFLIYFGMLEMTIF